MVRSRREAAGNFLQAFREFALKGNVLDLAVAVIIGGAFGKIVTSFVGDLVMPLINPLIPGGNWREAIVGPGIKIGNFLGSVVDFLIVSWVLFLAIQALSRFKRKQNLEEPLPLAERACPYCLETVPVAATKCRACTSDLPSL